MQGAGRTIQKVLSPSMRPEGDGARVRRIIGTREQQNFDPFLMMDHFYVSKPSGFPDHPHRGFETVTYMINGSCKHEDFKGHSGEISEGGIQWMTAGRGIVHAEMPGTDSMEGLQLWVNLARSDKLCEPQYQEASADQITKAQGEGVSATIIAGETLGQKANTITRTPAYYLDFDIEANSTLNQNIPDGWNAYVYVLSGAISVHGTNVNQYQAGFLRGSGPVLVQASQKSRFVLIAGQPIGEPIVQHGPFVMNEQREIEQTFNDYMTGTNGFEGARKWKSKIGR